MKNKVLILSMAMLLLNSPGFCFGKQTKNTIPVTQIKGAVNDYKTEIINLDRWQEFNDPILTGYITKALKANHDIKIAGLRVSEYKQLMKVSFGAELPDLTIAANPFVQEYSKNYIPIFAGTIQNYIFPLSTSYELDLWGKNHDKTLSAKKQSESVAYDEKAALISVVSEVASVYINILKTDKDITLQKQIAELKKDRLKIVRSKYDIGVSDYDEVLAREKDLTDAEITCNEYKKNLEILKTALAVLTGESPANTAEMKFGNIDNTITFPKLVDKIASDKILKRPDVLKAETQLQKAKIDVNIARKEFLPDITLTGQVGFNSTNFSNAFSGDSFIYLLGGNAVQSLFTGGRKTAMLKSKKYLYDQIFENYQKTLLTSLKEVNDSLLTVKTSFQRNEDYLKKLNLEQESFKLVNDRYEAGTVAYLDTLEPKERLISLQKSQIQSKTDYIIDNISLYKALGANYRLCAIIEK